MGRFAWQKTKLVVRYQIIIQDIFQQLRMDKLFQ